jgi:hypothetical protein
MYLLRESGRGGFFWFGGPRHQSFFLADPPSDIIASEPSARQPASRQGARWSGVAIKVPCADCGWSKDCMHVGHLWGQSAGCEFISIPYPPPWRTRWPSRCLTPRGNCEFEQSPISSQPDPPVPGISISSHFLPQSRSSGRPNFPVHSQFLLLLQYRFPSRASSCIVCCPFSIHFHFPAIPCCEPGRARGRARSRGPSRERTQTAHRLGSLGIPQHAARQGS